MSNDFFTNMPPQIIIIIIIIRLILMPFNATSNTKSPSTRGQQPPQKKI
jgi:membrane protein insertase Oxa1/YidC/SpoIIIJ